MYGGDVGPKSDIYSLGLILAAAASGRSLPMGTSTIEVVQARQRVPDLKGVPAELRGEIAPMLAPDPKDRPASMHELVPRGRTAKSKPPAGKRTQPPAKKTARPKKPGAAARAAVLTLVGLLALGAAGGGGWWYWQQSQSSGNGNGQQAVLAAMTGVFNEQDCARLNGEVSDDGTLTVSGRIGSAQARDALIDRLAAIDGVERVEPFLAIRPCDQPQPPFDRQAVRVALDRTFAAYACSDLSASLADDGTVRLAGEIGSGEDLASLRQQVRAIEGVRRVEDTLSIVPCPGEDRLPDLRAAVDRALGDFAGDACADLSAELAEGGRVRLFGHVGSREEFQAAQDRVAGIDGVTAVDNAVAVRPCEQPEEAPEEPARPDRQTVMAAVNRAVQAVECGEVSAQLDQDRTVRLTGTIGDQSAERALRSAVGRIDGVSGVTADFRYRPCRPTDVEPAALAGRVAEIAEGVRCAGISTDVTDDRHVVLSGYVGSERDRRRLESRLLALDDVVAVDGALAVYPWPLCEAIGLARLGEAGRAAGLEIAASNPDGVYSAGELLALEIDAPDFDGFVYVDYFDNQGNVVHMLPAPARPDNAVRSGERITIGDADDGGNPYPIPAANGPHLVLVVAAPSKLFALDRSQVEDARGYLRDLRSAIRRVNNGDGPDAVVGYQILTLQPS
jgi:osmotically-inducible protein OsmY